MKIFFAIPMYRGVAHPACVQSLEATLALVAERGHESTIGTCAGCCYIQFARNRLVRDFLKTDADVLFFIDDDVSWNADDALRLIESQEPVVAGVYRLKNDVESYPVVVCTDEQHRAVTRDGTISAKAVPAGMLRIHRSVIERLVSAYPEKSYYDLVDGVREDGYCDLFPQGVYGDRWVGEDYAFCRLWTDLGGYIGVLPNMTLGHHSGERKWVGNYHEFLMRQPGGSKAA
jgi:hypothetical protein